MSGISSLSGSNSSLAQVLQLLDGNSGASSGSGSIAAEAQQLLSEAGSASSGSAAASSSSGQTLAQQLEAAIVGAVENPNATSGSNGSSSDVSNSSLLQSIYGAVSQTLQANGININQPASSSSSSTTSSAESTAQLKSMLGSLLQSSENQSITQSLLSSLSSSNSGDSSSLLQLLQNLPSGTGLNLTG